MPSSTSNIPLDPKSAISADPPSQVAANSDDDPNADTAELAHNLRRLQFVDSMVRRARCMSNDAANAVPPPLEKTILTRDIQHWLDSHADAPHPSKIDVTPEIDFGLIYRHDVAAGLPANDAQSLERIVTVQNTGDVGMEVVDVMCVPSEDAFKLRWEVPTQQEVMEGANIKMHISSGSEGRLMIRVDDRHEIGVLSATVVFVLHFTAPTSLFIARTAIKAIIAPPLDPLFELNIGAPRFVPRWMRDVWDQPIQITYPSVPPGRVDFEAWVHRETQVLLGGLEDDEAAEEAKQIKAALGFLTRLPNITPIDPPKPNEIVGTMLPLAPETYALRHTLLLRLERGQRVRDTIAHDLYDVPLKPYKNSEEMNMYELSVPGLAENAPYLVRGDEVRIRQIFRTTMECTDVEYTGFVWHVDRRRNIAIVRLTDTERRFNSAEAEEGEGEGEEVNTEGDRFCVRFVAAEGGWRECARAVAIDGKREDWESGEEREDAWTVYRSFLFPEPEDGVLVTEEEAKKLPKAVAGFDFVDPQLNWEQKKAVERIVNGGYGKVPFVVSGPPGTNGYCLFTICEKKELGIEHWL